MKCAVLTCKLTDGNLASVQAESLEPMLSVAKRVRDSGVLDIAGVPAGVAWGILLHSEKPFPVMRFRTRVPVPVTGPARRANPRPRVHA